MKQPDLSAISRMENGRCPMNFGLLIESVILLAQGRDDAMKIYRPDPAVGAPQMVPAADQVPLLDMQRQHQPLKNELMHALEKVVDSGKYIFGPNAISSKRPSRNTRTHVMRLVVRRVAMPSY